MDDLFEIDGVEMTSEELDALNDALIEGAQIELEMKEKKAMKGVSDIQ